MVRPHRFPVNPVSIVYDTHTHIYTEEFAADRAEVVRRACEAGVERLLLPAIDEASLSDLLDLCGAYPDLCRPMLGLHPTELPEDVEGTLDRMEERLFAPDAPYVAVGEIGVDLYWDASRREQQLYAFRRQLTWAERTGLPVSIHARAAHRDLVETVLPFAETLSGGVFHCFGGTVEEAVELLEKFPRFSLGIGGVVTFKKSTLPDTLRAAVPLGRIVLETDAPYLAPAPHRGKRNEPAYLTLVLGKLAEIYEVTPQEVDCVTTKTARSIFARA